MGSERRYDQSEIEDILGRAVEGGDDGGTGASGSDGLTLAELQDVGREAGIAPERIAEAARALDHPARVERTLGLTLRIGRTTPLPRPLTHAEWEALVADLRSTFSATGNVHSDGGRRGWTNGNLHAWVEPEVPGYRLRMGTTKGSARQLGAVGAGMLGMSGILGTLSVMSDIPLAGAGALLAMGVGTLVAALGGVPAWARTRLEQMDGVARRLVARVGPSDLDERG